jgi:hypothetical protein
VVRISILYPGEPSSDSLKLAKNFVLGKVSDDYGLSKLQVVYYPRNKRELSNGEQ